MIAVSGPFLVSNHTERPCCRHAVPGGVRTPWCMGPTAVSGWGPPALRTMTSWQRALATGCSLLERGPPASSLLPCMEPLPRASGRSVLCPLLLSPVSLVVVPCRLHMHPYDVQLTRVAAAPVGLGAMSKIAHPNASALVGWLSIRCCWHSWTFYVYMPS